MADFFSSPNIPSHSVSLFVDSAAKGTAAGNSVPGVIESLVTGYNQGVETYQKQEINDQVIAQNQLKLEQQQREAEIAKVQQEQQLELAKRSSDFMGILANGTDQEKVDAVLGGDFADVLTSNPKLQETALTSVATLDPERVKDYYRLMQTDKQLQKYTTDYSSDTKDLRKNEEYLLATTDMSKFLSENRGLQNPSAIAINGWVEKSAAEPPRIGTTESPLTPEEREYTTKYRAGKAPEKFSFYTLDSEGNKVKIIDKLQDPDSFQKALSAYKTTWNTYNKNYQPGGLSGQLKSIDTLLSAVKKNNPSLGKLSSAEDASSPTALPAPTPAATANPIVENYKSRVTKESPWLKKGKEKVQEKTKNLVIDASKATQDMKLPIGYEPVTVEAQDNVELPDTVNGLKNRVAKLTDNQLVSMDLDVTDNFIKSISSSVDRVNKLPGMENASPLHKGLIAVESAGRNVINKTTGAMGVGQVTEGAAIDAAKYAKESEGVDLNPNDLMNPEQNIKLAKAYVDKNYNMIKRKLSTTMASQIPSNIDPRMVLAAYNGGYEWIRRGIDKGNIGWEDMKEYIKDVKKPTASKENLEYVDKVIAASLMFMKGGNLADELWLKELNNFGIVSINKWVV